MDLLEGTCYYYYSALEVEEESRTVVKSEALVGKPQVAAKEEVGQAASAGLLCHFSSVANVLDMLSIVGVLLTAWRLLLGHQSAEGVLSSNGGLYELQTRYLGAVTVVLMLPQAMVHLLLLRVLMLYLPTPNDPPTPQTSQFRHPL